MQNTSSPENVNNNEKAEEISLREIVQFLQEGKRWIISALVIFMLIGVAYLWLTPPQYSASANIIMASVADKSVEEPDMLAEKLKLPLYYSENSFKACNVLDENPTPGEFLAENLKRAVNKNAPIVSIKVKGDTPDQARQCLEAVISDIRKKQNILAKPILDTKKSHMRLLQQKIAAAEKLTEKFQAEKLKFNFDDQKFSASALLLATIIEKETEVKEWRYQLNDLEITLAEPQTKETTLVTPIYASPAKTEPKALLVLLSSAIAGLFFGIVLWAIRKSFFKK